MALQIPKHIFVGSTNPVKINAVKEACALHWPKTLIEGFEAASGIADQPMSDQETRQGARARARAAYKAGRSAHSLKADQVLLGVGLEGGVDKFAGQLYSTVWVAVTDGSDRYFESNGARFIIPEPVAGLILSGGEMGPLMEELVGEADVRRKQGMIGIITNNFVDRTSEYSSIAAMAIGLWYGQDWHQQLSTAKPASTTKKSTK